MSARRYVDIFCDGDGCLAWCESVAMAHVASDAREQAAAAGWLVGQPGGRDYCPACRIVLTTSIKEGPSSVADRLDAAGAHEFARHVRDATSIKEDT